MNGKTSDSRDVLNHPEKLRFNVLDSVSNPRSVHGIYPYRGKISALDAQQVLSQFSSRLTVLDPFCGSGTIVYEAAALGHRSVGVELNPIAQVLTEGKISINSTLESFLQEANDLIHEVSGSAFKPQIECAAGKHFHTDTYEQISKLSSMFESMSPYVKACFAGTICLAARGCNWYKWTSSTVGKDIEPKQYIDFHSKFLAKIRKHYFPILEIDADLVKGDSRDLSVLSKSSVDLVFTSPPYFDCLDYTAYYAKILYDLVGINRLEIKNQLIQKYGGYESDMKIVLTEIEKVVKPGGLVIFVVGDKKVHGKVINGGEFFRNLTSMKHIKSIERSYSGTSSKVFDAINKTQRKEQIVVWRNEK
jgi:16S rRNA G966 N2-methylase RsmD